MAPFVPVASSLARAGHDVTFVAPEGFRSILEPEPFRFAPYWLDRSPAAGALGGVAAALTAGPVVVHPQLFDQLWHGRRVEGLGVGLMARTPRQVVRAVRRITADEGYAHRAAALAARLRSHDGTAVLADAATALVDAAT